MLGAAEPHEPAFPIRFALDREWRVTSWNREAERVTSFSTQDMLGRDFISVMVAEWIAPMERALRRVAAGEKAETHIDFWTRTGEKLNMRLILAMENNRINLRANCDT
eukprot:TRINITY_DN41560_c0_g1_i1.p2 TRINITY_DN41560_c0_g1~~TRINITY_DN41560_c0_g1_i1.p2  ORF type:complete len:108 (-),score=13.75 TRINITY_DN41560_c0_g1_i1:200-523(-)